MLVEKPADAMQTLSSLDQRASSVTPVNNEEISLDDTNSLSTSQVIRKESIGFLIKTSSRRPEHIARVFVAIVLNLCPRACVCMTHPSVCLSLADLRSSSHVIRGCLSFFPWRSSGLNTDADKNQRLAIAWRWMENNSLSDLFISRLTR